MNIKFVYLVLTIVISVLLITSGIFYSGNIQSNSHKIGSFSVNYNENATLIWGGTEFVDYLNPFLTHYMTTQTVMELVYPALAYWSANMTELVPYLATSWDINYTNHTAIFHLNKNAVWSDGVPITAQDVVFSFNMYKQPWTHEVSWFKSVISTTALNNYTVEIKFTGLLFIYLALPQPIVPYHIWKNINASSYFGFTQGSTFVGGGPFLISSYTPNAELVLVKNPKFWDPIYEPHYSKFVLSYYTSQSSLIAALETGEVSMAFVPSTALPTIVNSSNLVLYKSLSSIVYFMSYNQYPNGSGNPYLRDIKVREALNYAINVSYLIKTGFRGLAVPAVGLVPYGNPYYDPYLKPWPYNITLANELLNQSGLKWGPNGYRVYPNGSVFKLNLAIPSGMTTWISLASVMVNMWKAVGVDVSVSIYDTATMTAITSSYSYDMAIHDWFSDANFGSEVYVLTSALLHTYTNSPGYSNVTYDKIYSEMVNASSISTAIHYCWELQNITYQNATILPLVTPYSLFVSNVQWKNVPGNYSGEVPQFGYGWWLFIDPYEVTSTPPSSSPSSPGISSPLLIAISVVVVILVIALIVMFIYRRSNKNKQKNEENKDIEFEKKG